MPKKIQIGLTTKEITFLTDFFMQMFPVVRLEEEEDILLAKNLREKVIAAYEEAEEIKTETEAIVEEEDCTSCADCDSTC